MALNKEIEDQFSSAVKSALDAPGPVTAPSETITSPVQAEPIKTDRSRRSRAWGVALLCLALAAMAVVVVVAVLHVRRSSVEIAAMQLGDAASQSNPTAVAPAGTSWRTTALAPIRA